MTPQLGSSELFPHLEVPHYLNTASIAPLSLPVQQAMEHAVQLRARLAMGAIGAFAESVQACREGFGTLVGASADDVAVLTSTSAGIVGIASCLDWQPGDRVVLFASDFPANTTPWLRAAEQFQLEVCWHDGDAFRTDPDAAMSRLEAELARGVRLVAVSAVSFWSGIRRPVKAIAERCRHYGAELFVDGIQAAGVTPLSMDWGIDYLAVGGHKWLGGPFGTGLLAVAPERWQGLQGRLASWMSHPDALRFLQGERGHLVHDKPIVAGPAMFEGGAFNGVGAAGLAAALDVVNTLGVEAIHAHVSALNDGLHAALVERGVKSWWSSDPGQRAGALVVDMPEHDVGALVQALAEHGVSVASPNGRLRVSPGWGACAADMQALVAALDAEGVC